MKSARPGIQYTFPKVIAIINRVVPSEQKTAKD